jgi:3-polyprenyl-4-hydroxybenzoate decarboxylase
MGEVPPHVRRPEGPFGDHYGYYSLRHDYPEFRIAQVAHRRDAIYPATVVGKPRQEDFYIGDLLQELLSPLFPLVMPAVEQLWSYGETGYHSLAAAVVKQRYKREAMSSAFRILGEGQLSLTKFLFLTDRAVNLKNFRATLEHVLARTDPRADLYVFSNLSMDTLDYTGPSVNEGSKGVWLGLGDPVRELPRAFVPRQPPPAEVRDIRVFCGGCLVVEGPCYGDDPSAGARLAAHPAFAAWPLVVLTDDAARATRSEMNFLWTTFTRFEPAADIHAAGARVVRHHVSYDAPVLIDARMKPWYPDELSCRPDVAERVTSRWKEYFPGARVEMGDSERGHLD